MAPNKKLPAGAAGGLQRGKNLTAEQRRESAIKAIKVRWGEPGSAARKAHSDLMKKVWAGIRREVATRRRANAATEEAQA